MLSNKIKLIDGELAGIKVKMNGTTVFQGPSLEMAISRAKMLDNKATEFEYTKRDGTVEVVQK